MLFRQKLDLCLNLLCGIEKLILRRNLIIDLLQKNIDKVDTIKKAHIKNNEDKSEEEIISIIISILKYDPNVHLEYLNLILSRKDGIEENEMLTDENIKRQISLLHSRYSGINNLIKNVNNKLKIILKEIQANINFQVKNKRSRSNKLNDYSGHKISKKTFETDIFCNELSQREKQIEKNKQEIIHLKDENNKLYEKIISSSINKERIHNIKECLKSENHKIVKEINDIIAQEVVFHNKNNCDSLEDHVDADASNSALNAEEFEICSPKDQFVKLEYNVEQKCEELEIYKKKHHLEAAGRQEIIDYLIKQISVQEIDYKNKLQERECIITTLNNDLLLCNSKTKVEKENQINELEIHNINTPPLEKEAGLNKELMEQALHLASSLIQHENENKSLVNDLSNYNRQKFVKHEINLEFANAINHIVELTTKYYNLKINFENVLNEYNLIKKHYENRLLDNEYKSKIFDVTKKNIQLQESLEEKGVLLKKLKEKELENKNKLQEIKHEFELYRHHNKDIKEIKRLINIKDIELENHINTPLNNN